MSSQLLLASSTIMLRVSVLAVDVTGRPQGGRKGHQRVSPHWNYKDSWDIRYY